MSSRVALSITACGTTAPSDVERITIESDVGHAETAAAIYCAQGGPMGAEAVRVLARLVRTWPDLTVDGKTVRERAVDVANELEGCGDGRYADRLDRVLRG